MSSDTPHKPITLFTSPESQYSHRVRYALAEKLIEVEEIEIFDGAPNEDLALVNPTLQVPTLSDRDTHIYGSTVIMEYLDERYPSPPLMPAFPSPRAEARIQMIEMEQELCQNAQTMLDRTKEGKRATGTRIYQEAKENLRTYASHMSSILRDRSFFLDHGISLVDCCALPVLWRLQLMDVQLPARTTRDLRHYMERMFARIHFQQSLSDEETEMRD